MKGPTGTEVRPTGDRLKETLFDIIGDRVAGAVLLDAFGGTGAIGIEGLSRGAREVVFIENTLAACRLIKHNLDLCSVKSGYRLLQQDVFTALRSLAREGFRADIIFFDPPYDWKPYRDLIEIVFKKNLLSCPTRCYVVIEHHRKAVLPESGTGYYRSRLVRQGDHCLSFYRASS